MGSRRAPARHAATLGGTRSGVSPVPPLAGVDPSATGVAVRNDDCIKIQPSRQAATRGADLVVAPSEPYPFAERHRSELAAAAGDVRFVDGRDLLWWGARTGPALERLQAVLA